VPASHVHVDEEGPVPPAPGEDALGVERKDKPRGGTLSLEGEGELLEYSLLEGSCRSAQVISYLDAQASQAERAGEEVVVVLDNAPFHTAAAVREREEGWEEMGLSL
jgi:hypothetical protein